MPQTTSKPKALGSVFFEQVWSRSNKNYRYLGNEYYQSSYHLRECIYDYYPFGSSLPTRSWSDASRAYRYGFNTQEKDNEVAGDGNSYSAEFWQIDSRIGRRFNLDPKPNFSISFYSCFWNNPINISDYKGDTLHLEGSKRHKNKMIRMIEIRTGNDYKLDDNGNVILIGKSNKTRTTKKISSKLSEKVEEVINSDRMVVFKLVNNKHGNTQFDNYDEGTVNIKDLARCPPAMQAGQIAHILQERISNPDDYNNPVNRSDENFEEAHYNALILESQIVSEMLKIPFSVRSVSDQLSTIGDLFFVQYNYGDYHFRMRQYSSCVDVVEGGANRTRCIPRNGIVWAIRNKLYHNNR